MKKMKKLFAMLLTLAMVFGMSMTSFAATRNTASITVKTADSQLSKATLTYAQVIKADRTTETGWNFVNDDVAQAYMDAFGVRTAQDAIKAMIPAANADASKLGVAQANAAGHVTFIAMANPQEVAEAGVYLVKATEETYTYNIMSAYIGFGEVTIDGTTYEYPSLTDANLTEKKSTTTVDKAITDGDPNKDNVVKNGDILTYTVKAYVPYINPTDENKTFFVHDELTGAEYYNLDSATITLAGTNVKDNYTITPDGKTKFKVDLSTMINDANSNAGLEVVITYQVKVTSENDKITNTAKAGHEGGDQYGSETITTYEGNITLTKYGENENTKLAGAGFEVRLNNTGNALKFRDLGNGVYVYDPEGTVTTVVTNAQGTLTVKGLDTGTYYFKEVQAPTGYSVNTTDVSATLTLEEGETTATAVLTADTSMTDTKLSSLPSTGGIGTTIFTIAGCVIMIAAAGLFFASRKKSDNK